MDLSKYKNRKVYSDTKGSQEGYCITSSPEEPVLKYCGKNEKHDTTLKYHISIKILK